MLASYSQVVITPAMHTVAPSNFNVAVDLLTGRVDFCTLPAEKPGSTTDMVTYFIADNLV